MIDPEDLKIVGLTECEECGQMVTEIVWRDDVEGIICAPCYEQQQTATLIGTETGFYACLGTEANLLHCHNDNVTAMQCTDPASVTVCWLSVMITDVDIIATSPPQSLLIRTKDTTL
jgi:hypothetical protein